MCLRCDRWRPRKQRDRNGTGPAHPPPHTHTHTHTHTHARSRHVRARALTTIVLPPAPAPMRSARPRRRVWRQSATAREQAAGAGRVAGAHPPQPKRQAAVWDEGVHLVVRRRGGRRCAGNGGRALADGGGNPRGPRRRVGPPCAQRHSQRRRHQVRVFLLSAPF